VKHRRREPDGHVPDGAAGRNLALGLLRPPLAARPHPQGPRARAGPVRPMRGRCVCARRVAAADAPLVTDPMARSAAMRFSVAGWVEKRLSMRAPESGLTMK